RRNKAALASTAVVGLALLVAVAVLATSTLLIARALQSETQALERERVESYFHRIALAHSELSVHNLRRALDLLNECPEDLRDWEWHYLRGLCQRDPVTLQGHGGGVRGIAFSPDGRSLATANADGTVGLFDAGTGVEFAALRGHKRKVRSVAFHPLGTRLASVGTDFTVKVWGLTKRPGVFVLPGNEGTHQWPASGVALAQTAGSWPPAVTAAACSCAMPTPTTCRYFSAWKDMVRCRSAWRSVRTAASWPRGAGRACCGSGIPRRANSCGPKRKTIGR